MSYDVFERVLREVMTRGQSFATVRDRTSGADPGGSDRSSGTDPLLTRHPSPRETRRDFRPSGRPAGKPGDPVVKSPRQRAIAHPGPPLENAAQKAKDAPSSLITVNWIRRTRLSCVWRGLLFATTFEVVLDRRRSESRHVLTGEPIATN
jgi:hypothetical protein